MDNLTPLDNRSSLFLDRSQLDQKDSTTFAVSAVPDRPAPQRRDSEKYLGYEESVYYNRGSKGSDGMAGYAASTYRPITPNTALPYRDQARESLLGGAAPVGVAYGREPTLPNIDYSSEAYGNPYGPGYRQSQGQNQGQNQGYGGGYARGYY
jgi:hypothetical protein